MHEVPCPHFTAVPPPLVNATFPVLRNGLHERLPMKLDWTPRPWYPIKTTGARQDDKPAVERQRVLVSPYAEGAATRAALRELPREHARDDARSD